MYAPACSSASGSPPSSLASSPPPPPPPAPAAPVPVQQEPRRHRPVQHRHLQRRPPGQFPILAGDQHPPAARGQHPRHRRRVRRVVQDQQPVSRPASAACTGPPDHRSPSPAPSWAASSPNPAASPAGSSAASCHTTPHLGQPAGRRTPPPRWSCPHPPSPPAPPPTARHGRRQPGIQFGQQLLPARQEHRSRRQPHRHPRRAPPAGPRAPGSAAARERLKQQHLQPIGRIHRAGP